MKFSELQLFAEAIPGKKIVYLYRVKGKSTLDDAKGLAFTTENERTKSKMLIRQQQKTEQCVLRGLRKSKSQLPVF